YSLTPAPPSRAPHPLPTRRSSDLAHPRSLEPSRGRFAHGLDRPTADVPTLPLELVVIDHVLPLRHVIQQAVGFLSFAPTLLAPRSEEHTSELQSRSDLVCRLLLEK